MRGFRPVGAHTCLTVRDTRMGSKPMKYVALLRGVNNAGMARRVAMADLRALFESLGFRDVRTVLNSGNVVFSVATTGRRDVRARIQNALACRLQLTSVRNNPLSRIAINPSHLLVLVPVVSSSLRRLRLLLKERWAPEAVTLGTRVAYLWCARASREVRFGLQPIAHLTGWERPGIFRR